MNPDLLDLVQLPISLYDQRLLHNGTVARLRSQGAAIHARSVYLQGLLLKPADRWPSWVSPEVHAHQRALENLAAERGCQLIDLALGFARELIDLEAVVIGLSSPEELMELRAAWVAISPWEDLGWQSWALGDPNILDPRRWPR